MGSRGFNQAQPRREKGVSMFSSYSMSWRGCIWQPLLKSAPSLQRATMNGVAAAIARGLPSSPGIFELALAAQEKTENKIVVFVAAADNIMEALLKLLSGEGDLQGFFDHALKEGQVVWVRAKTRPNIAAANASRDSILAKYDYAWVNQSGYRARSVLVKYEAACCCCCTSMTIREGSPKFVVKNVSMREARSPSGKKWSPFK